MMPAAAAHVYITPHCTETDLAMPFIEAIAPATALRAISWRRERAAVIEQPVSRNRTDAHSRTYRRGERTCAELSQLRSFFAHSVHRHRFVPYFRPSRSSTRRKRSLKLTIAQAHIRFVGELSGGPLLLWLCSAEARSPGRSKNKCPAAYRRCGRQTGCGLDSGRGRPVPLLVFMLSFQRRSLQLRGLFTDVHLRSRLP